MNRHATIKSTGRYIPEIEVHNDELRERFAHIPDFVDKMEESSAIRTRWWVPDDWATSDLALPAARQALERAGRKPEDVDLIILGTDSPDYTTPATSVVVQHKLGAVNAGTFDIGCACASFPTGLAIASGLIGTNLGAAFRYRGDYEAARDQFAALLEMEPDFAPAHLGLGNALLALGEIDAAIVSHERAANAAGGSPLFDAALAHTYALAGREAQAREVEKVKRSENGIITDPVTLPPSESTATARKVMQQQNISGIPIVVEGGKLVGILTRRDMKFLSQDARIDEVMTRTNLVTAPPDTSLDAAADILNEHKVEKLLLVDGDGRLAGLITMRDIDKLRQFPRSCKDPRGRLRAGAAVGGGNKGGGPAPGTSIASWNRVCCCCCTATRPTAMT